jgi:hypothetical protein
MKSTREMNQAYDAREQSRVRPKAKEYQWQELDQAIRSMIERSQADESARILQSSAS